MIDIYESDSDLEGEIDENEPLVVDFHALDVEINEIKADANSVKFTAEDKDEDWLDEIVDSAEDNEPKDDDDDLHESSAKCLKINLGTNELPRFSCGCHKLNCAIRRSMRAHSHLANFFFY